MTNKSLCQWGNSKKPINPQIFVDFLVRIVYIRVNNENDVVRG